jgi:hypothetical protein
MVIVLRDVGTQEQVVTCQTHDVAFKQVELGGRHGDKGAPNSSCIVNNVGKCGNTAQVLIVDVTLLF